MKYIQPFFQVLALSLFAVLSHGAGPYQEGVHYVRLAESVPTTSGDKIEVAEVFSYACPACFRFEGPLKSWKQTLPDYVEFVPLHMQWDKPTEYLARAMYTAQALKMMDKMHPALFKAIHLDRKPLNNEVNIENFFVSQGIDRETFKKTYNSFGISSRVKQGDAKIKGLKINSTPQLAVNGEYTISLTNQISPEEMLKIADFLIAKTRSERGLE